MSKLNINIPDRLCDNSEIIFFTKSNAELLNNWSVEIENLTIAYLQIKKTDDKKLNAIEKIKTDKIMRKFRKVMINYSIDIALMERKISILEDGLSKSEAKSFSLIVDQLMERVEVISHRYEIFFSESSALNDSQLYF